MTRLTVPLSTARALHLSAQGLAKRRMKRASPPDVVDCIRRMHLLQIDTIHVVARSPYLVLFSRLGDYDVRWLDQALVNGDIFEYWAHEACFIPREDYRLIRPAMLSLDGMGWKYSADWYQQHQTDIEALLGHVHTNGPVRATDFEAKKPKDGDSGWWEWKPEKRHLETLFTRGELMVCQRENFHRIYDVAERVLPEWDDAQHAISAEAAKWEMLCNSARALGVFRAAWLADYYRLRRVDTKSVISQMLDTQQIVPLRVDGLGDDLYLHADLLPAAQDGRLKATHTTLLSPFDPVVWDRRRALELFNFDYRLECYTPEAKRQYGYFVLPILQRGVLTGRLDAKLHRKQDVLELKAIYLEQGVRLTDNKLAELQTAISRFAQWQQARQVTVGHQPDVLRRFWADGWAVEYPF